MRDTLISIARHAGDLIMQRHQKDDLQIAYKRDVDDPVTIADKTADTYIREQLARFFPEDQILSEETASTVTDRTKHVRIVDPLDGTKDFAAGKDIFGILIWRCTDGIPDIGISYFPVQNELYFAQTGKGARMLDADGHEHRLTVSWGNDISYASIEEPSTRGVFLPNYAAYLEKKDQSLVHTKRDERIGPLLSIVSCMGRTLTSIASGRLDAKLYLGWHIAKRDTCTGQVLLQEAGGVITNIDGTPLDYTQSSSFRENWFVAATAALHPKLCRFLQKS